jgi:transposase
MAAILEECGYDTRKMKAQCRTKAVDCHQESTMCCCHWTLFNEPDFQNVDSLLEVDVKAHSFHILFLLKFHCELNFIEQCWGHAKHHYRLFPASSKDSDLEKNVVQALDEVPLISMHW